MRLCLSVTKSACSFASLLAVASAVLVAGCDSSGDPNSPDAQKNREALSEVVSKQEAAANKNSRGVVLKSIKNFKTPPQAK